MNKSFLNKKTTWIVSSLLVLVIAARFILPGVILKNMNEYLGKFSPLYSLHIKDMNFHFWRLAYSLEGVEGKLKEKPIEFLDINHLRVSLALRELFRGRFVVDIVVRDAALKVTTETLNAVSGVTKDQAKADAKNIKDETVPFDLERVTIHTSRFEFSDVGGLPPEQNFNLANVEAVANNLTPLKAEGMAVFSVVADVQGDAKIKLIGQFKPKKTPVDWSVNTELKNFNLTLINPIARRTVPLTFKSGKLSLFSAVQSVDHHTFGYVKPFLKDTVFVGDRGDFKNVGQFFIEIAGTIGNFFLKNPKNHALAMKVAFKTGKDGKIETDTGRAIKTAMDNAFGDSLSQSLDETLELK